MHRKGMTQVFKTLPSHLGSCACMLLYASLFASLVFICPDYYIVEVRTESKDSFLQVVARLSYIGTLGHMTKISPNLKNLEKLVALGLCNPASGECYAPVILQKVKLVDW
ncbi:UNVERIFIED_CONTAM: hypothetical protein Sangu_0071500 [Sesamum angustifolium]|uniref:Uncharacterized protein n=1 Tax=Sesamum angustifolium TaxID=2727405 RepID=A0AAW2RIS1_9LAMI